MVKPTAGHAESGQPQPSQLFTIRLWLEDQDDGQRIWRGKVQHVLSGEALYFRDWPVLTAFLCERISEPRGK